METESRNIPFANGHKDLYVQARNQYLKTPWWKFKDIKHYRTEMRIAQYNYKKITGKNIEL